MANFSTVIESLMSVPRLPPLDRGNLPRDLAEPHRALVLEPAVVPRGIAVGAARLALPAARFQAPAVDVEVDQDDVGAHRAAGRLHARMVVGRERGHVGAG